MAEFRCTWWEDTGRLAETDKSGVQRMVFRNLDTGEETTKLPPGALFAQRRGGRQGADGLSIVCIVPYGRDGCADKTTWWRIDSRATNCTMPEDGEHRCWVRHGTVGEAVHVDKNGNTCGAGAGSIAVPGFHGFLHHGVLRGC